MKRRVNEDREVASDGTVHHHPIKRTHHIRLEDGETTLAQRQQITMSAKDSGMECWSCGSLYQRPAM